MRAWIIGAYVAVFWLVLPAILLAPHLLIAGFAGEVTGLGLVIGLPVAALGVGLMAWAAAALGRYGHGLPISHLPPTELVRQGPFAFLRHPMYTGFVLLWTGVGIGLASWPIIAISVPVLAAECALYAAREEAVLERRFGSAYEEYRRQVTDALLPRRLVGWLLGMLAARLVFDFRVRTDASSPPAGACVVIAAHRNYLDPLFLRLALRRPIRFLTTHDMYRSPLLARLFARAGSVRVDRYRSAPGAVRAALELQRRGEAVGVFPSGGRSWTGDESYPADLARLLVRSAVPVVPVVLSGTYGAWPRWGSVARAPVCARVLTPRVITSDGQLFEAVSEVASAGLDRGRDRPSLRRARGVTRALYLCPSCEAAFALRLRSTPPPAAATGSRPWSRRTARRSAALVCSRCGARFVLVDRASVRDPAGRLHSLSALRVRSWEALRERDRELSATGEYWLERGVSSLDERFGRVRLTASARGLSLETAGGSMTRSARCAAADSGAPEAPRTKVWIPAGEIDAVLIRGNATLQVYSRRTLHTVRVRGGRALALQDLLRIAAFGDPRARRRGITQVAVR